MNIPADLRYCASHEWIRLEGDIATVGISDHAQAELTDVVFVELPSIGRKVDASDPTAVVESVKAASDIYAPVDGEVVAFNDALGLATVLREGADPATILVRSPRSGRPEPAPGVDLVRLARPIPRLPFATRVVQLASLGDAAAGAAFAPHADRLGGVV